MKAILVCDYDDYSNIYDVVLVRNRDLQKALEVMEENNYDTYEALFEALEKNGIKYKIIKDYEYLRR